MKEYFEILEFTLNHNSYAIDISYITEIINYQKIQTIPNAHPCIEGVLSRRNDLITIINLNQYFSLSTNEPINSSFVITKINDKQIGFRVDKVVGIQKIEDKNIIIPNKILRGTRNEIDKIIYLNKNLSILLDIDFIIEDISHIL